MLTFAVFGKSWGFYVYSLNMWENLKSKHFFGNDPDPLFRWLKKPVFLKWVRLWVESGLVLLSPLKWVLVGFTAFQLRLRRSRVFELSQLKRASPIINILFSWPAGPSQFWFSAVQPVLIFSCSASFDIQLPSQFWYSAGQLVLIFSCSATNQQLAIWNLRLQLNPKCILYQSSCSSNYHKHWDSSNLKTSI